MNKPPKIHNYLIVTTFSIMSSIFVPSQAVGTKTMIATAEGLTAAKQAYNYAAFITLSRWSWTKLIGTDNGHRADPNFFISDRFKQEFPNGAFPQGFFFGAGDSDLQSGG